MDEIKPVVTEILEFESPDESKIKAASVKNNGLLGFGNNDRFKQIFQLEQDL